MTTRGIYRPVPYLAIHWREKYAFPILYNGIRKISQPFSCRTDTSNKDGFSVHSKIFAINDIDRTIA